MAAVSPSPGSVMETMIVGIILMKIRVSHAVSQRKDLMGFTCSKEQEQQIYIVSSFTAPPTFKCPHYQWECPGNSRVCINRTKVCDGNADCPNGDDESPICSMLFMKHVYIIHIYIIYMVQQNFSFYSHNSTVIRICKFFSFLIYIQILMNVGQRMVTVTSYVSRHPEGPSVFVLWVRS